MKYIETYEKFNFLKFISKVFVKSTLNKIIDGDLFGDIDNWIVQEDDLYIYFYTNDRFNSNKLIFCIKKFDYTINAELSLSDMKDILSSDGVSGWDEFDKKYSNLKLTKDEYNKLVKMLKSQKLENIEDAFYDLQDLDYKVSIIRNDFRNGTFLLKVSKKNVQIFPLKSIHDELNQIVTIINGIYNFEIDKNYDHKFSEIGAYSVLKHIDDDFMEIENQSYRRGTRGPIIEKHYKSKDTTSSNDPHVYSLYIPFKIKNKI